MGLVCLGNVGWTHLEGCSRVVCRQASSHQPGAPPGEARRPPGPSRRPPAPTLAPPTPSCSCYLRPAICNLASSNPAVRSVHTSELRGWLFDFESSPRRGRARDVESRRVPRERVGARERVYRGEASSEGARRGESVVGSQVGSQVGLPDTVGLGEAREDLPPTAAAGRLAWPAGHAVRSGSDLSRHVLTQVVLIWPGNACWPE
jgi:hypothetical protein